MIPAMQMTIPEWFPKEPVQDLFTRIGADKILTVGGCVRNIVMGRGATDIDFATILQPEDIMECLENSGFQLVPTGLKHGTVTVIPKGGPPFEITTLRRDVMTNGRHAQVAFTNEWEEDAKRRDFTMNALYMDLAGNIFDPLGCGIEDAKAGYVRFVGDAVTRIAEDHLRILRFFRFLAQLGALPPEEASFKACVAASDKIKTLSRERITQEFLKLIIAEKAPDVLTLMRKHGVMGEVISKDFNPDHLRRLHTLQAQEGQGDAMACLFIVHGNRARFHEDYFRLSHAQAGQLIKLEIFSVSSVFENPRSLKKEIFYHGREALLQGYFVNCILNHKAPQQDILTIIKEWSAPPCPITGQTLLAEGYQTGPELGQELERRIAEWVEEII